MFKGVKKYWFISIACGLIAAVLFYLYLGQVEKKYRPDDLVQVVRAAQPITADEVIKSGQLITEEVPSRYAHANGIREASEALGKISNVDIAVGEEIIQEKLVGEEDKRARLAYSVPLNKRAVAVTINETSAVSFNIQVGDHVDVMATIDVSSVDSKVDPATTVLILQDIEILSVGSAMADEDKNNTGMLSTLTLAVTPEQARPLVLASERGAIRLMLRSPVDDSQFSLPAYKPNHVIQP